MEETDTPDPDSRWDRASTHTEHFIYSFEVGSNYYDLSIDFDPEFDVDYYLLFAVYSTGDTFGYDAGYNIEFLGLYEKPETADMNKKRVESRTKDDNEPATLLTDFGIDYEFYIPWFGYFENLDHIDVETIRRSKKTLKD